MNNHFIKYQKMLDEMASLRSDGRPTRFSLTFFSRSDRAFVTWTDCHLTSRHSSGGTVNIQPPHTLHPRNVRTCLITEFNHKKVYH